MSLSIALSSCSVSTGCSSCRETGGGSWSKTFLTCMRGSALQTGFHLSTGLTRWCAHGRLSQHAASRGQRPATDVPMTAPALETATKPTLPRERRWCRFCRLLDLRIGKLLLWARHIGSLVPSEAQGRKSRGKVWRKRAWERPEGIRSLHTEEHFRLCQLKQPQCDGSEHTHSSRKTIDHQRIEHSFNSLARNIHWSWPQNDSSSHPNARTIVLHMPSVKYACWGIR